MVVIIAITLITNLLAYLFGVGVEAICGPVAIGMLSVIITDLYFEGGR